MDRSVVDSFWRSWACDEGLESFDGLLEWVRRRNAETRVRISPTALPECSPWFLDDAGVIRNPAGSFFRIAGLATERIDPATGKGTPVGEQPVLLQDEIGYLGVVAKDFGGVVHLLMQAKIEPGNVNKVQVSPTIQATRSNFLQLHGGRRPAYLEHFLRDGSADAPAVRTLFDQVQSEQSSRFLGKRNRNVMVLAEGDVEALPSHRWMTIGQVKRLMRYPNLVNMDTRTVLSCIPWALWGAPAERLLAESEADLGIVSSLTGMPDPSALAEATRALCDAKMFDFSRRRVVGLGELRDWEFREGMGAFRHRDGYPFSVGFFDIEIEGREVTRWSQPLFEAQGMATFALVCRRDPDRMRFLVRVRRESGCFDAAELAPTLQREAGCPESPDAAERAVLGLLERREGVVRDVVLSEEGGRFYCEQNRNALVELSPQRAEELFGPTGLPKGYLWADAATLGLMALSNNNLNIQLRNLLSLLDPFPRPEDGGAL